MKILKNLFKEKLQVASAFLKSSISEGITGVLIETSDRGLEIHSTNLSSFYQSFIKVDTKEKDFSIVIEPKKIIDVLNNISIDEIDLEVSKKKFIIKANKTKAVFPTFEIQDYPKIKIKQENKKKISEDIFKKLPLILLSAAIDDSRPVLTGVNFIGKEDKIVLVATDGFRLSLLEEKSDLGLDTGFHIVPADFLRIILREVKDKEELFFFYDKEEKLFSFFIGENTFSTRLIEGEFPPFERVIPENFTTEVVLERSEFLRNVKFASIFAKEYSNVILLHIEKEGVYVYPKTEEDESDSKAFQEAQVKGEGLKVAFNFKFILDFLSKVQEDEIRIKLVRSEAPVVFEIVGREDFLHIIMPVRIS